MTSTDGLSEIHLYRQQGIRTVYTLQCDKPSSDSKYLGLKLKYNYDACGIQTSVSNADKHDIWKLLDLDAKGQIEREQYGNGLITTTADQERYYLQHIDTRNPKLDIQL